MLKVPSDTDGNTLVVHDPKPAATLAIHFEHRLVSTNSESKSADVTSHWNPEWVLSRHTHRGMKRLAPMASVAPSTLLSACGSADASDLNVEPATFTEAGEACVDFYRSVQESVERLGRHLLSTIRRLTLIVSGCLLLPACLANGSATSSSSGTMPDTPSAPATQLETEPVVHTFHLDFPVAGPLDAWELALFIPYGEGVDQLGNGVSIGEDLGPEAPVIVDQSGRWWVADNYKERVARFSASGGFLDDVSLPPHAPLAGMRLLSDGRIVAASSMGRIAIVDETAVAFHAVGEENVTLLDAQGTTVFALPTFGGLMEIEFATEIPSSRSVDSLRTGTGSHYLVHGIRGDRSTIQIDLPDANPAASTMIQFTSDDRGTVIAIPEAVSAPDGSVHILIFGLSDASPDLQRSLYVMIHPDGRLAQTEGTPNPIGVLDSGSLGHLSLDEMGRPLLSVIDEDGIRVWRLTSQTAEISSIPAAISIARG
jgi:hypothetical protein